MVRARFETYVSLFVIALAFIFMIAGSSAVFADTSSDSASMQSGDAVSATSVEAAPPITEEVSPIASDPGSGLPMTTAPGLVAEAAPPITEDVLPIIVSDPGSILPMTNPGIVSEAAPPITEDVYPFDVIDTVAPVIALIGANTVTIALHGTYTESGATVTDNIDTGLIATASGTVNTDAVGAYTITYNAIDSSGNMAVPVTRTVNVVDTSVPASPPSQSSSSNNNGGGSVFFSSPISPVFSSPLAAPEVSSTPAPAAPVEQRVAPAAPVAPAVAKTTKTAPAPSVPIPSATAPQANSNSLAGALFDSNGSLSLGAIGALAITSFVALAGAALIVSRKIKMT